MDRDTKNLILSIAGDVRSHMEDRAYHETTNEKHRLDGYCAIASAELYHHLCDAEIKPEIHAAESSIGCHVFLAWSDYVIDITATQFDPYIRFPVLIKHSRELQTHWYHRTAYEFEHPKQLVKWQKKTGWARDQMATATRKLPKL